MKCLAFVAATVSLACSAIVSVRGDGAVPDGGKQFSYKTGDDSVYAPAQWSEKYPNCGGKRQSPIDIVPTTMCRVAGTKRAKSPLTFSGECGPHKIKQYYDAFKAEAVDSECKVTAHDKSYKYALAHFHEPAEHTLNGKVHDAEIHFVHKSDHDILVVGLFFEIQSEAKTDPFVLHYLEQIKNVNANKTAEVTLPSFHVMIESAIAAGRLFNYPGSLTSPTCDETVDWWVVEKPLAVSASDYNTIQSDLKRIEASDEGKAARPVQPLNGRAITTY